MIHKAILAGFGGQGILMMGVTLANAAMREDKHVTYLPTYGAEVRGGTANCTVAISDEEIASPIASSPDYAVVMNKPSLNAFQNKIQSGGVLFINTTMIDEPPVRKDIQVVNVDAGRIAEELGEDHAPKWNFHKYLIGKKGDLAGAFPSKVAPLSATMIEAVEAALAD